MSTGQQGEGVRVRAVRWLRSSAERVPFRWLTGALTGAFLVATAAFGGLEAVEAPGPAEFAAGERHENALVALELERAVLIDSLPEAGASAGDGERVLGVVMQAEATWDEPVGTALQPFAQTLRLEALPDLAPVATARFDDTTQSPVLQPGVPAQLVTTWLVPADAFAEGDEVRVVIHDLTAARGSEVLYGDYWTDPTPAAVVTLPAQDVGAGADAEDAP